MTARSAGEPGAGADGEEGVGENPEEGKETEIGIKDAVEKIHGTFAAQKIEHVEEGHEADDREQTENHKGFSEREIDEQEQHRVIHRVAKIRNQALAQRDASRDERALPHD